MRKLMILLGAISILLVGCSTDGSTPVEQNISEEQKTNAVENTNNKEAGNVDTSVAKDSEVESDLSTVKIVEYTVSAPAGDRTEDNYAAENGEYFAIGSDIVKCSDYDNIHVIAELTNNTDSLLNTSAMAWGAEMEDGYKLEIFQDGVGVGMMNERNLGKQIQSGSTITVEFDILKEKSVKGDAITLKYWDVDFGDEFGKFMSAVMGGSSENQCKKDYPQYFDESKTYEFELSLK